MAERRAPTREQGQRVEIERQGFTLDQPGERLAGEQRRLKAGAARRIEGAEADSDRDFLERLADGGNPRRFARMAEPGRESMVVVIDAAAGKDDRAAGEGHAGRSLDDQKVGRGGGRRGAHHDQRGGGDGGLIVGHRPLIA